MRSAFPKFLIGSLALALLLPLVAFASEPISIEALSRLPAIQSLSMTPDGKHLVGLIPSPTNKEETALAMWDANDISAGPKVVTPSGDHMKFIAAYALKAGKILTVARQEWTGQLGGCGEGKRTGATRTFVTKAYLTGLEQKKFNEAFASQRRHVGISKQTETCLELAGTASLVDMLPLDPDNIIIRRGGALSRASGYYLFNLKTGKAKLLFRGSPSKSPALFDSRTGDVLVQAKIEPTGDDYEQQILIKDPKSGEFVIQKPLTTVLSDRHTVDVVGVDKATGKYYVLTDQFSDKVQLWLYDAAKQKYDAEPAVAQDKYSITGVIFGRQPSNFDQLLGFVIGGPHPVTVYVDPKFKAIQASLKKAFPGQQVNVSSYTDKLDKVLFTVNSASMPPAYYMLVNGKKVESLGSKRPWIKRGLTGTEKWVTYTARDGLKIPAILDLPAGWEKGDAPAKAVVLPHGGPWARDYMGWDPSGWIPLLTSRGYAVLRPQYRGSSGLGRKLWLAGDAKWGLAMSDDLDDGAKWLVEQGIADKNRIAIFGYSYGGFAAIAADVRSPSPFQCAISGAPVADLGRLGTSWSSNRLQRILQGKTVKGMDPMKNAAKAHLPILILVGDRDVRTPRAIHAKPFYEAVKGKVHAEYHEIPNMPHSMPWYPSQMRTMDKLIVGFLANECGFSKPVKSAK